MRSSGPWLPLVLLVLVASGACVKKSTHQKTVADLADARARISKLELDVANLTSGKSQTEEDLARVQTEKDATESELADLRERREADEKRLAAYQDLQSRFKELVDAGALEVTFRNGQMTLKLPSGVLFPSAGAELSEGGKKTLTKVTKVLMALKDRRFLIAGHTDNVPIATELFPNNWVLSTARAISVVQFMVEQGFPADQLGAAGYADKDPIAKNKTKKGRQKNRRIEIILVPDLSDLPKLAKPPS
jgi:chemotaxis protein MotB